MRRSVRHAAIPHAGNDYRPHLIRRKGLAVLIVAVAAMQIIQYGILNTAVLGRSTDITRQRLLDDTNQERRKNGQLPLTLNENLNYAADLKAENMFEEQYWAHDSPSGIDPWHWFTAAEYTYDVAGENLAKGFRSSKGVVTAWMNSPEHKANLISRNYQEVGFAVAPGVLNGEKTMVVVALYASPSQSTAATKTGSVLAAVDSTSVVAKVGTSVQLLPPLVLGSITLLLVAASVALAAHSYRAYLPRRLRRSWYRHHGIYKAASMTSGVIVLVALYGGGQI